LLQKLGSLTRRNAELQSHSFTFAAKDMAYPSSVRKLDVLPNMRLTDLIGPEAIVPSLKANSKKQMLQELSERAARISGLEPREIFDALLQRERLGSTGTGNGVALPHTKLAKCKTIFGVFARLEKPIDYAATDAAPVDLVFMLIAPESAGADHLKALARIARVLRDPAIAAKLRATRDSAALYAVLTQEPASHAA
jgi:PTS system nitrogen regulatory IIA component